MFSWRLPGYANMPNRPVLRHGGEPAFYLRSDDLLQMPRPDYFTRREHYYSTLYHELPTLRDTSRCSTV
jgi:antirestriction protein ArdC